MALISFVTAASLSSAFQLYARPSGHDGCHPLGGHAATRCRRPRRQRVALRRSIATLASRFSAHQRRTLAAFFSGLAFCQASVAAFLHARHVPSLPRYPSWRGGEVGERERLAVADFQAESRRADRVVRARRWRFLPLVGSFLIVDYCNSCHRVGNPYTIGLTYYGPVSEYGDRGNPLGYLRSAMPGRTVRRPGGRQAPRGRTRPPLPRLRRHCHAGEGSALQQPIHWSPTLNRNRYRSDNQPAP